MKNALTTIFSLIITFIIYGQEKIDFDYTKDYDALLPNAERAWGESGSVFNTDGCRNVDHNEKDNIDIQCNFRFDKCFFILGSLFE